MTKDECLKLVRDAAELAGASLRAEVDAQVLKAVLAEREACAQSCVEISKDYWMGDSQFEAATRCANAIRERSIQ